MVGVDGVGVGGRDYFLRGVFCLGSVPGLLSMGVVPGTCPPPAPSGNRFP